MRVIPNTSPAPRLITSLAPEKPPEQVQLSTSANGSSLFYSNTRVILGILLAALGLFGFTYIYSKIHPHKAQVTAAPELVAIPPVSQNPPPPPPSTATGPGHPDPLRMINMELIRVTAISVGKPSLAIINGEQLAEGDELTLRQSKTGPEISLQVLKIEDGQVELTDGSGVIHAFLEVSVAPAAKPR